VTTRIAARSARAGVAGILLALVAAMALVSCSDRNAPAPPAFSKVALVPRGEGDLWWRRVGVGATRAAREAGRVLINAQAAPTATDDQAQIIRALIAQRSDAIVVAPSPGASEALGVALREAVTAGIPLVFIDDDADGPTTGVPGPRVNSDNQQIGVLAAEFFLARLPSQSEVLVVGDGKGSTIIDQREIAFRERLRESSIRTVDAPPAGVYGKRAAQLAIEYALDSHPGVTAMFCPDEASTLAALQVLRERSISGRVRLVGVETNPYLVEALAAGEIEALVIPNIAEVGRRAVLAAVSRLKGEAVDDRVLAEVTLVAREDMHDKPNMDRLLPELVGDGN